ncbi:hypothetical protein INS49_012037 [Diaporthe citri]|uniref:uncharacterized protein n=1 Tax=Diaporthe citri TaxID=83186 RepID=UPI001C80D07A|nr:uncharacterized protein INS49_012037 [Diaporthe citri]KAG6360969.1 hypothetical protein INS49_012037 [Diaporthe citri]
MKLPMELMCKIIREVIDTPAVFVFDVVTGTLQHSQTGGRTDYRYMSFHPRVNPPSNQSRQDYAGTFESQVSKTIRSLLLTNRSIRAECLKHLQGITVPIANGQAVVRFNPRKHVICLYKVGDLVQLTHRQFMIGPQDLIAFAKQLTDLNFDINHLGFMSEGGCGVRERDVAAVFRSAFPTIQHLYAVVTELPRKNPSEPIDFVCPAHDPRHTLSPMFLHIAKRSWNVVKSRLFGNGFVYARGDWDQGSDIDGMVLI